MSCPSIPIGDDATMSGALAAIDCQVNAGVASAYGRLFAAGGAFSIGLTAVLTIYVALLAFGFMTGRTRLTLPSMTPKVIALCLVLTFATSWQAYHVVVHGLLSRGPDQIAAVLMGASGSAAQAFAARLDALFAHAIEAAQAIGAVQDAPVENLRTAHQLIWFSALTLLLSTAGMLVAAKIILALLMAIGPIFVVLALFASTRGLFEAWLRTTLSFALAPMLIVLGGGGVMAALGPVIDAIAADPGGSVENLRPIVLLFLGSIVYAVLIGAAAWTAVALTRGWRLARNEAAETPAAEPAKAATAAPAAILAPAAAEHERTTTLIAAITRSHADHTSAPVLALPAPDASPHRTVDRRRIGLGQSFRKGAS